MKNLIKIVFTLFAYLISNFLIGQEKISISPIDTYKMLNRIYIAHAPFAIYDVQLQEVNYPIYEEGDVPTKERLLLEKKLSFYQKDYDEYKSSCDKEKQKLEEKRSVSELIDKYLNSKEKKDIKKQYIVEAQNIIDKYRVKAYSESVVKLYKDGNIIDKEELGYYRSVFANLEFQEPYKSDRVQKYFNLLNKMKEIKSTEKGIIMSENTIKKEIFVIDTTGLYFKELNGTYEVFPEKYQIVYHKKSNTIPIEILPISVKESFFSNEDLVKIDKHMGSLVKNTETGQLYLLYPEDFLEKLKETSEIKQNPFIFVRQSALKLEKDKGKRYISELTKIEEKRILGMYPIQEIDEEPNYETSPYIKFTSIPTTEKFIMITDCSRGYGKIDEDLIIQNIKTKQLYLVSSFSLRNYQDLDNMTNESLGRGFLTMDVPKELTPQEKQSVQQYHSMLKTAYQKGLQLRNIQKKYLTRTGLFDPSRATATDKATYNRILKELKAIYSKMREMTTNSSGTRDVIENSLSTEDAGALDVIAGWYYSYDI